MAFRQALDLNVEQFRAITKKELSKRMAVLTNTANKRLTRLHKAGLDTPASKYAKFKYSNMTLDEMKEEFSRVRNFLNLKSSTVRGARKIEKELLQRLGADPKVKTDFDRKQFWEAYNKIKQTDRALITRLSSSQVQENIYNMMIEGRSVNQIIKEILGPKKYEESVEEESGEGLFEILDNDS